MNVLAHSSWGMHNGTIPCEGISCLLQMVSILFILIVVAYIYYRVRTSDQRFRAKGKLGRKLEILETKPLGNRQFLVVVSYENEKFLLGIHPNGMQFLSTLPKGKEPK